MTEEKQALRRDAAFAPDTWLLVLNPVSGRGAGLRHRHRIEAALLRRALGVVVAEAAAGRATALGRDA